MKVNDLFNFKTGSLPALEKTEDGEVPLVYGTSYNNGIVKFVKTYQKTQIFQPPLITVSYLGTAFVQVVRFTTSVVDKSNIIILEPKNKTMTLEEMYFHTTQINRFSKFGFHYGRRMNMRQLREIPLLPFVEKTFSKIDFSEIIPKKQTTGTNEDVKLELTPVLINDLFILHRGDFHNATDLSDGITPLVSCGENDNGVLRYCAVPENKIYSNTLTIAYNGRPLTTKFHPYKFAAKDDVAVCLPKKALKHSTLVFIQYMINRERWRYSYGRKCFNEKLTNLTIYAPIDGDGNIDESRIERVVSNTSYWAYLLSQMQKGIA